MTARIFCPRPRFSAASTFAGIKVQRRGIDVRQHRSRTAAHDGANRGEEAERRGNDSGILFHAAAPQRQPQRIRTGRATNAGLGAKVLRRLALEGVKFGTADEMLRGHDPLDGRVDVVLDGGVLPLQVEHGNGFLPGRGRGRGGILHGVHSHDESLILSADSRQ